jgi:hypothetical protein
MYEVHCGGRGTGYSVEGCQHAQTSLSVYTHPLMQALTLMNRSAAKFMWAS